MRIAACFLQHTHLEVSEIAEVLGYAEVNKFQQAFRRFHNCPPVAFRNRCGRKVRYFILGMNGVVQGECKVIWSPELNTDTSLP
jgi:AraC-like DNA-binding protein